MVGEVSVGLLVPFLMQLHILVVGVVGLYFAVKRRRRHRRVSNYATVGFSCLLVSFLIFVAMQIVLPNASEFGIEPSRVGAYIGYFNFAAYPVSVIALASISIAVFIDRTRVEGQVASNSLFEEGA